MSTHRTMLFDHCVITIPAHDDAHRGRGTDGCEAELLLHWQKSSRAVGKFVRFLPLGILLLTGIILFGALLDGQRQSKCARPARLTPAAFKER